MECLTNEDCSDLTPLCNTNNTCESITIWNGEKCICNPENMPTGYNPETCSCPIGYQALPLLNASKEACFPECTPELNTETGVILMVDKSNRLCCRWYDILSRIL